MKTLKWSALVVISLSLVVAVARATHDPFPQKGVVYNPTPEQDAQARVNMDAYSKSLNDGLWSRMKQRFSGGGDAN